jgi:rubrerythrin
MAQANQMGLNRTGIQMSPSQAEAMVEGAELFDVGPIRYDGLEEIRRSYIAESEPVGAVPLPGTLRGALSTGKEKLKGHNPEILINKLGERLAFERTGVRLYDAMILKCEAAAENNGSRGVISLELLRKFRNEEAEHFFMVRNAMASLGADPTAQTPDADVMGVASSGINKVLTEPRTSISQCLEALQIAELADNAAWELLRELCLGMGLDEMANEFQHAIAQEDVHAVTVNAWIRQLALRQSGKDD